MIESAPHPTLKLPLLPSIPHPKSVWAQGSSKLAFKHLQPQGHKHRALLQPGYSPLLCRWFVFGGEGATGVCENVLRESVCVLREKASNQNKKSLLSFLPRRPQVFFLFFWPKIALIGSMKQILVNRWFTIALSKSVAAHFTLEANNRRKKKQHWRIKSNKKKTKKQCA